MKKPKIEAKMTFLDKIILWLNLPELPKDKKYESPYKLLKRGEYNLLKTKVEGIPAYITQIRQQNEQLENQKFIIEEQNQIIEQLTKERKQDKNTIRGLRISKAIKERQLNDIKRRSRQTK